MRTLGFNGPLRALGLALPWLLLACDSDSQKPHYSIHVDIDGGVLPASGGAKAGGSGGASTGGSAGMASGGNAASGGAAASGGSKGSGGSRASGGTSGIPAEPDSGIPPPPMRTGKACSQDSECPSGLCLLGICDEPGCGPSKGITEICDGLDNDCDGIADDEGACSKPCRGFVANGHTYAFCASYSYFLAEKACRSVLMHVARLDSQAEIMGLVPHLSGGGPDYAFWISGSELADPGTWRFLGGDVFWKGNAAPAGTAQNGFPALWLDGQPNDLGNTHVQQCLTLESQGYADADCSSKKAVLCEQYNIPQTGCFDGVRDGDETDVDCGGSCSPCPFVAQRCAKNADCRSQLCLANGCADDCTDQVKNDTETDVDCGGVCPRCAAGLGCKTDYDCGSRICNNGVCGDCMTSACPKCEDDMFACCAVSNVCSCNGLLAKYCF